MEYRVVWEMDIEADSPREAAEKARAYQRDTTAQVGVFDVSEDGLLCVRVDLDEDEESEG